MYVYSVVVSEDALVMQGMNEERVIAMDSYIETDNGCLVFTQYGSVVKAYNKHSWKAYERLGEVPAEENNETSNQELDDSDFEFSETEF